MGALLAYTVYTGIFLLAGYLLYKLAMAGEKQTMLNRCVLFGIYALSLTAWPLSRLDWAGGATASGDFEFELIADGIAGSNDAAHTSQWACVLIYIYIAGMVLTALWTAVTAVRLVRLVRSGRHENRDGYTLVLLPEGKTAPFSWGRYVVMSEADYETAGDTVSAHELAHIRCRHSLDMLVAQAVCILLWYNPASWLMREELKTVHEYQADAMVLASGIDPRTYQMLLIKKAVGTRFQSLANSLNHSKLKKRITMMHKEKNSGLRRLRGLVLALAPVAAIAVVNIPAVASGLDTMRATSVAEQEPLSVKAVYSQRKDTQNAPDNETKNVSARQAPDKYASFPGGEGELYRFLAENINYPAEAMEANHEGNSVVSFTVTADGTLSDFEIVRSSWPELDAEAIRVLSTSPKWQPAVADNKHVACSYTLPVSFRLDPGKNISKRIKTDKELEELVVVGYGKASDNTKTVNISMKDLSGPNAPAVFIDGVRRTSGVDQISPEAIESITVHHDSSDYPNGRIDIVLKK